MSANISDYFNKASNMNGSYPPVATVTSARAVGGATLSCDDLGGWATDTPVHFSTFKVSADGTIDTTTQTDWKGIVVGNTITEMTRLAGAADSGNASGDKVELNPTIGWLDDLVTGLLVSHKQNGALKDSVVTESTIATGAVTNSKIGSAAVKSSNVDWSTMDFANYRDVEQDTGFTWLNGEKIYKKTIHVGLLSDYSTSVPHNISNLGTVIRYEGASIGGGVNRPVPYAGQNGWAMTLDVNQWNILVYLPNGSNLNYYDVWVTIYYTKSS